MSKITYLDKQPLQDDEEIPAENKVTADDLNEIKRVVNANADTLETKQPKETGKGLSTNDFTNSYKAWVDQNHSNIAILQANSGHSINVSIDLETYILTFELKNLNNKVLSTKTVDLPLETMLTDMQYDSTTKELVITLQNGQTRRIPLTDIISGLVNEDDFNKLAEDALQIDEEEEVTIYE